MTQEDKELLLKDLCARLPYKVNIQVKEWATLDTELKIGHIQRLQNDDIEVKPYLRKKSSMTEEEYNELKVIAHGCDYVLYYSACFPVKCNAKFKTYNLEVIDWLNAHHFDYRGLIKKGLAIEVTEENNPYNKQEE